MILIRLNDGYEVKDIVSEVMREYGYEKLYAENLIRVVASNIQAKYNKLLKDAAKTQWEKLEMVVGECLERDDYANAIKAIDLQNKITKLYEDKFMNVDAEQVFLKFD